MECCNCGAPAQHRHHIVPRAVGGTDRDSNLAPVCAACHGLIHGRDLLNHRTLTLAGVERARATGRPWGRSRSYTQKQAAQAHLLRQQGASFRVISRSLNLSLGTVQRILKTPPDALPRMDWDRTQKAAQQVADQQDKGGRPRSYSPEQADLAARLRSHGHSFRVIAKTLGLSLGTVQRILGG